MRLYGKNQLKDRLDSIAAKGRLPHAILLHGERGVGKRTMARYISKLFMCGALPCESCAVCSRINSDSHPDIIFVKRECGGKYNLDNSGQSGLTSVRKVMESIAIKPNDSNVKIYVFEDCDDMSAAIQNTLLKTIEEPAPFLRFIFTCENTDSILETIRSRVTEFEVPVASFEECAKHLSDSGHPFAKSCELAEALSGNIGKCLDVLSGGGDAPFMEAAKKAALAIANRNQFQCTAALSQQTGRTEFATVLGYLTEILRDALAAKYGGTLSSCGRKEAEAISNAFSEEQILHMLDSVFKVSGDANYNINMALTASYLTTELL